MEQCLPLVQNANNRTQRVSLNVPLAAQGVACQECRFRKVINMASILSVMTSNKAANADNSKIRCDSTGQQSCSNCRTISVHCSLSSQSGDDKTHTKEEPVSPSDEFPSQGGWIVVPKQEDDRTSSWVPRHFIARNPHDFSSQKLSWHGQHGPSEITLDDLQFGFTAMTPGPASTLTDPEFDLLRRQGAFVLPPQWLCHILFQAYFDYIAPTLPIIEKDEFMRRFADKEHPISYLLIHAVLLAGCRVCRHTCIRDADGSTTRMSRKLYRRAKALYDTNYESDQLVVVQTLILLGWYWEGPEDILDNSFYWTQLAITVAQGLGMHRRVQSSALPTSQQRLWKRIWWTLFCRDRTLALARGRPFTIRDNDTDVEEIRAEDLENFCRVPADSMKEPIKISYFLQYVELSRIVGKILQQRRLFSHSTLTSLSLYEKRDCQNMLHDWYCKLPSDLCWDPMNQDIWPSILQLYYYSIRCLLHLLPTDKGTSAVFPRDVGRTKLVQSTTTDASMISCILAKLRAFEQIAFVPCFVVYSTSVAMITHANEILRSIDGHCAVTHQAQLDICMDALRDLSKSWLVAEHCFNIALPIVDGLRVGDDLLSTM